MSATADQAGTPTRPVALVIVRNGVTHDARVLRAANALKLAGAQPLILGVVTDRASDRHWLHEEIPVLRIEPRLPFQDRSRVVPGAQRPRSRESPRSEAGPPSATRSLSPRARLGRLAKTVDYYRRAIGVVLRVRTRVVHANDYNTMWVGVAAKLLAGSRLVYDAHELWPDRNGRWEVRWWLLACEALFVRIADAVVTASPGYAACMARRYRIETPTVVRNISDTSAERVTRGSSATGSPRVVYVGGMLRGRGLEQTIDALPLVSHVELTLIGPGDGAYVEELRRRAAAAGVSDRVDFRDPVLPDEVGEAIAGACLGLSIIQPVCLTYELTLPNKVFEYLAAGLPVLVSDLPVMAAFVAEHGVGEAVAPADPVAIAAALDRLTAPEARSGLETRVAAAAATLTWALERERLLAAYRLR